MTRLEANWAGPGRQLRGAWGRWDGAESRAGCRHTGFGTDTRHGRWDGVDTVDGATGRRGGTGRGRRGETLDQWETRWRRRRRRPSGRRQTAG